MSSQQQPAPTFSKPLLQNTHSRWFEDRCQSKYIQSEFLWQVAQNRSSFALDKKEVWPWLSHASKQETQQWLTSHVFSQCLDCIKSAFRNSQKRRREEDEDVDDARMFTIMTHQLHVWRLSPEFPGQSVLDCCHTWSQADLARLLAMHFNFRSISRAKIYAVYYLFANVLHDYMCRRIVRAWKCKHVLNDCDFATLMPWPTIPVLWRHMELQLSAQKKFLGYHLFHLESLCRWMMAGQLHTRSHPFTRHALDEAFQNRLERVLRVLCVVSSHQSFHVKPVFEECLRTLQEKPESQPQQQQPSLIFEFRYIRIPRHDEDAPDVPPLYVMDYPVPDDTALSGFYPLFHTILEHIRHQGNGEFNEEEMYAILDRVVAHQNSEV